jgi:hypothetical protein
MSVPDLEIGSKRDFDELNEQQNPEKQNVKRPKISYVKDKKDEAEEHDKILEMISVIALKTLMRANIENDYSIWSIYVNTYTEEKVVEALKNFSGYPHPQVWRCACGGDGFQPINTFTLMESAKFVEKWFMPNSVKAIIRMAKLYPNLAFHIIADSNPKIENNAKTILDTDAESRAEFKDLMLSFWLDHKFKVGSQATLDYIGFKEESDE